MRTVRRLLATFFGLGYVPLAPGTAASLAVVLFYKFILGRLAWPFLVVIIFLLLIGGVGSASAYAADAGEADPRQVVIDEAAGQLIVLLLVPPTWLNLGLAFFLFRFFDIVKPFPVSRAERLPGGWGIMADDVVAGALSGVLLHIYLFLR
jgi:phosphatidylglycerophosphatase A